METKSILKSKNVKRNLLGNKRAAGPGKIGRSGGGGHGMTNGNSVVMLQHVSCS